MDTRNRFILIGSILISLMTVRTSAQDTGAYTLTPAPDLWYNDVDGIRAGIRVLGEMEGSFKDGPHRLDLGVWLGTWFPEQPLSYYISLIEPIPSLGDYGNEANIELRSGIRTGFTHHGLYFNKRFQPDFDELNYTEIRLGGLYEQMNDAGYRPFPALWNGEKRQLAKAQLLKSIHTEKARTMITIRAHYQLNTNSPSSSADLEVRQLVKLNNSFKIRTRFFAGIAGDDTDPQNAFLLSMDSPVNWLNNGVTRAKGTIPQPWLKAGSFQVAGGGNVRGYLNREINSLNAGQIPVFKRLLSLNLELEYPNPLDRALDDVSVVGDLANLRSYVFWDAAKGMAHPLNNTPEHDLIADGGLGFQFDINIPDYLGKDRAVFIRYDVPIWLLDGTESTFRFRQLVGFGAIFSF